MRVCLAAFIAVVSSSRDSVKELYDRVKTRAIVSDFTSSFNFYPEVDFAFGHALLLMWDSAKNEREAAEFEGIIGNYAESCSGQLLYLIFDSFERGDSELDVERRKLAEAIRENSQLEKQFSAVRHRFRASYFYIRNLSLGVDSLFKPFPEMEEKKLEIERLAQELRDCVLEEIPEKENRLIGYLKRLQREFNISNRTLFELCRPAFENILDLAEVRSKLRRSNFAVNHLRTSVFKMEEKKKESST